MARDTVNPYVGVNYIDDNTKMAIPPAYWLQRLYDFDADLVVFPSRYRPFAYVLARRQRQSRGRDNQALIATITQPDTKLCLERGLVPVTLIFRTGTNWSIDNIIASLQARDIWAHGGGDKAADLLDASEAKTAASIAASTRDDMWMRSGQAWESYKRRSGQRVSVPGSIIGASPTHNSSSGSTAKSGLVLAH